MNKEAREVYINSFEEELEKVGKISKKLLSGFLGTAIGGVGLGGVMGAKIGKAHESTLNSIKKARDFAGKKWDKLSPYNQAELLSTFMGPGNKTDIAKVRKQILGLK